MISTGKSNNNVLEKTETATDTGSVYENRPLSSRTAGKLSGDFSVSNDMMRNYAEKGLIFEENLREESFKNDEFYGIEEDDATPSATTMQFTYENEDFEEEEEQNVQKSYKISPRGKIMITVYALVVATIIALIAMNARVLKSMENSITEKEQSVAELAYQTQVLEEELSYVSSEEVISAKAAELGMTK